MQGPVHIYQIALEDHLLERGPLESAHGWGDVVPLPLASDHPGCEIECLFALAPAVSYMRLPTQVNST